MLNKSIATALALAASFGFTQTASAADEVASPATVIIYRADETVKTKRLDLDISADEHNLGKLSGEDVMVAEGPAGLITLGTSLAGTESLTIDLKPGATYYVHTRLKQRGSRIYVSLEQVEGQVATVQQPALASAI